MKPISTRRVGELHKHHLADRLGVSNESDHSDIGIVVVLQLAQRAAVDA